MRREKAPDPFDFVRLACLARLASAFHGLSDGFHAFLIHRLHLIVFDGFLGGIFLAHLLLRSGNSAGGCAAGQGEQEHGEDYRYHNRHGNPLTMTVLGVAK